MLPAIELRQLRKRYSQGVVGLEATDLTVEAGERLAILGPSGSGKTTLLRLIAGLENPDEGKIFLHGEDANSIPPHRREIGWLPQRPALYPHLKVRQHLQFRSPISWKRSDGSGATLDEAVRALKLNRILDRLPDELSGGERQRVALARIWLRGPSIWLLDEPFSGLDPIFRDEFRHDLHLLLGRTVATILIVTHDASDASALGRRIGVLGEGRIRQIGTPELLSTNPGNRFVAFSLGCRFFVEGLVGIGSDSSKMFASLDQSFMISLPERLKNLPLGQRLTVGLSFANVLLKPYIGDDRRGNAWMLLGHDPLGAGSKLTLTRRNIRLMTEWRNGRPPPIGSLWEIAIEQEGLLWFDGETEERV